MSEQVEIAVKRISRYSGDGTLRAYCDVAVGNAFLVTGLRVVEGKKGLFVSMPRQQGKNGNWYDTVMPLTKEAREQISGIVLKAYRSGVDPASDADQG